MLEAEQIEIWRDEKKMEARGHIVAIFQQEPGTGPAFGMVANKTSAAGPPTGKSGAAEASKATLWQIRSPSLTYWSDQGRAHLEGGVVASSDQGSLESRSLDVFLAPGRRQWDSFEQETVANVKEPEGPGSSRLLAQGGVVVRQEERRGTAEQAEYTAADQKFVLSGGQPTITDAASDTTTQRAFVDLLCCE